MKQFYNVLENNIDVQEEPPAQVTKRISEQTITDCWRPFTEVDFWQTKKTVWIRWREHFISVLNRPFHIDKDDISRLPQVECNIQLDFTTVNEKMKTILIRQGPWIRCNSCRGYQTEGQSMAEKLTELFHCMYRIETTAQELKDNSIIQFYKLKVNPKVERMWWPYGGSLYYRLLEIYSRFSLSRTPKDSMKHFEIPVLRHIRFAELRKTTNRTTTFNKMNM